MKKTISAILAISLLASGSALNFAQDTANTPGAPAVIAICPPAYTVVKKDIVVEKSKVSAAHAVIADGKTMIPLRATLEAMGYKISYNAKDKSAEISKGAQWTSVKAGVNSYIKNKMAPFKLSCAPAIIEGKIMVPAEFMPMVFGISVKSSVSSIALSSEDIPVIEGYVSKVDISDNKKSITVSKEKDSSKLEDLTIIHVSPDTIVNADLVEGERVVCVVMPFMTMSIPGQTGADIIYGIK